MATIRTAKKLMLGREIAHMIDTAGLSQAQAATILESSQGKVAGLIKGQGSISPGDLIRLASKLGFNDENYHETLLELRRDNHKRGYWSTGYRRGYVEDVRLLIDLEMHADLIRSAKVEIIPGLAQCENYTRAIYASLSDGNDLNEEEHTEARLARQNIYDKGDAVTVHFILSESCLRRVWGNPQIMAEQLDFLIELSHRPNVLLQVLPFHVPPGKRSNFGHNFALFRVPALGIAGPLEIAYTEGQEEIRYLDDKKALSAHETAWSRLCVSSLNFDESRQYMKQIADGFREQ